MNVVLQSINLTKSFGMVRAADDLNVEIGKGQIVGIVGPNGSGKTTFLNLTTGYLRPDRGGMYYLGQALAGLHPRDITRLGIARSFQIPQLYPNLTVLETTTLALAIRAREDGNFWRSLGRPAWYTEAHQLLDQFGFVELAGQRVATLPEGSRKLLDVTLSFALRPSLMLLDEPTSGVSASEKFSIMDTLISVLRGSGVTTVFVEHDWEVVQRYAERVLVFTEGRIIADDTPDTLLTNPDTRRRVLGEE